MSLLLAAIDDVILLCTLPDILREAGAYDKTGTSTIASERRSDSQATCYAVDALSRWTRSVVTDTEGQLSDEDLETMSKDLCLQTLLHLMPPLADTLTIKLCARYKSGS